MKSTLTNYKGIINSYKEEAIEPVTVNTFKGVKD